MPVLLPPSGLTATGGFGGGGGIDEFTSRMRLDTTAAPQTPQAVATHYAQQLETLGWKVEGRASDSGALALVRMSTTTKTGDAVTAVLTITALPGTPYLDLRLQAVRNKSSSPR